MVIQLERWVPSREYTRVGVEENDISEDVLGIKIPKIVVPVSSGRSMSVIIEAAVMNMRLRDVGIDSSKEFVERILKNIDHCAAWSNRLLYNGRKQNGKSYDVNLL